MYVGILASGDTKSLVWHAATLDEGGHDDVRAQVVKARSTVRRAMMPADDFLRLKGDSFRTTRGAGPVRRASAAWLYPRFNTIATPRSSP